MNLDEAYMTCEWCGVEITRKNRHEHAMMPGQDIPVCSNRTPCWRCGKDIPMDELSLFNLEAPCIAPGQGRWECLPRCKKQETEDGEQQGMLTLLKLTLLELKIYTAIWYVDIKLKKSERQ